MASSAKRVAGLLRLAQGNENKSEAINALRRVRPLIQDETVAALLDRAAASSDPDKLIAAAIELVLDGARLADDLEIDRIEQENARHGYDTKTWTPPAPFITDSAHGGDPHPVVQERWVPGTVEQNPHGFGWRVRGPDPGFYSTLKASRKEAEDWADGWRFSGRGAFATGWDEPQDGSHLRRAAEHDAVSQLAGRLGLLDRGKPK